jgi:hypothetical protein
MPNDPAIERIRQAEQVVLSATRDQPLRLAALSTLVRAATSNPQFPDAEILTAICNLSDLGKIVPRTIEGCLHYATPAAWAAHDAPKPVEAAHA